MTAAQLTSLLGAAPPQPALRGAMLKAVLTLGLLGLLVYHLDAASIYERLYGIERYPLLLAAGALALQYVIACARWFYILRRLGMPVDGRRAAHIFGVGALANMLLVVSIAGLSVRAVMLVRDGSDLSRTAAALAAERIAAMAGLMLCFAAAAVPGYWVLKPFVATLNASAVLPWVFGLAALSAVAAWLLMRLAFVRRFARDLRHAFATKADAALMMLSSVTIVYLGFAAVAALASGMGIGIDHAALLSVLPIVAFLSALPVSFGGWGVREGAMVGGLTLFHVPADAAFALSISYGLVGMAVVALLGGMSALMPGREATAVRSPLFAAAPRRD